MSNVAPYLYFSGQCAAAFDLYLSVLGGEFIMRSTYANAPDTFTFPSDHKDPIMHITLQTATGSILMGADMAEGVAPAPVPSNNFALSIAPTSRQDAERIFASIQASGSNTNMPLQDTFWNAYFGTCEDRFGVHWMVNFSDDPKII